MDGWKTATSTADTAQPANTSYNAYNALTALGHKRLLCLDISAGTRQLNNRRLIEYLK